MKSFINALTTRSKLVFLLTLMVSSIVATTWSPAEASNKLAAPTGSLTSERVVVDKAYRVFIQRAGNAEEMRINIANYKSYGHDPLRLAERFYNSPTGQRRTATTDNAKFVQLVYRNFYNKDVTLDAVNGSSWKKALDARALTRTQMFDWQVRYSNKSTAPSAWTAYKPVAPKASPAPVASAPKKVGNYVECKQFTRVSTVKPLCKAGSKGGVTDVVVAKVPGSNIVANVAVVDNLTQMRAAAAKKGYILNATPGSKYPTAGSYRSPAAQAWLRKTNKYAAKGISNHQWGMAVDFRCNGKSLSSQRGCMNWMRQNAGKYGFQNKIIGYEPWHWSTTGR